MLIRQPHVAGTFYPSDPGELRQFCDTHLKTPLPSVAAKAVVLPHAGYIYSGKTAAKVLSHVSIPNRVFLIGPNHFGQGALFALASQGAWHTPLGEVPIDEPMAQGLLKACDDLQPDAEAHLFEHSLEVEIPFLQVRNPSLKILPLIVGSLDLLAAKQAALACGRFLSTLAEPPLVVVSTDMSHYESDVRTRQKDKFALEAIRNLDEDALAKAVKDYRITMCGFVPVYMLLVMKTFLGITKATLVDYCTSADATGDYDRVVGYAGFILE
ncbi:MAG TPA: AmmeMemoRadiSam system protein B [Verrucomicrobiae bacterium]|nr:AmmeMemoRadiSam system protein B [Verrucomicrobiae bacterium]